MISLEREGASRKSAFLDNRVQSLDIFYFKFPKNITLHTHTHTHTYDLFGT